MACWLFRFLGMTGMPVLCGESEFFPGDISLMMMMLVFDSDALNRQLRGTWRYMRLRPSEFWMMKIMKFPKGS